MRELIAQLPVAQAGSRTDCDVQNTQDQRATKPQALTDEQQEESQWAHRHVAAAIARGTWNESDAMELRAHSHLVPPTVLDELVLELVRAINSDRVKLSTRNGLSF
jgi:hypothetical protein